MCDKNDQSGPETKTILVIDDEDTSIGIIKHALTEAGYNVLTAMTGEDGLELAKENQPDVIITDVLMPSMDGFMLVKELKKNELTKESSILVLTARENIGDNLLRFGANAFLTKPIDPQALITEVQKLTK